jgi:hypothetical protein
MSKQITSRLTRLLAGVALLLLAPARVDAGACDCSTIPTLGSAMDYPAMSLWKDINISGAVYAENGNVGLGNSKGNNGKVSVSGSDTKIDAIYHHSGTDVDVSDGDVGSIVQQNMSGVVSDVYSASAAFEALSATQSFSSISSGKTITGNGCINVIRVSDKIDLGGSSKLKFVGGVDDYFIVNVKNGISIGGDARIELDGVEPNHVIFNMTDAGDVSLSGDAAVYGTFVTTEKGISVSGSAQNRGAYYAGETLSLSGSATWYGNPFECTPAAAAVCPDPEATGVNTQTPATPPARSTGNTPFYHSYYDTTSYEGHLESFRLDAAGVIMDESDTAAVDSGTGLLESGRDPYWDAGILLRSDTWRDLYTTVGGARVTLTTGNVSQTDLDLQAGDIPSYPNYPGSGVDTLAKLHAAVVAYAHGKDAFDVDGDSIYTEMRDAVMGDIFHSNVQFIGTPTTYLAHEEGYSGFLGDYAKRDRVVYVGANDALLHGFNAGAWYDPADSSKFNAGSGAELFGYMPGILLPVAKYLPKTIDANGDRLVPGFVDGNLVAADAWLGTGAAKLPAEWATVLISSFREGGAGYLALDITNPGAGALDDHGPYPKLLWEFTHAKLGNTWSKPVITRLKVRRSGETGDYCGPDDGDGDCREQWVAIFAGGFEATGDPNDAGYISNPASGAWRNESKALYIVALDTGAVLASVEFDSTGANGPTAMKYSITSAPTVIDLDNDGFADVVYIGDLGGQIWKWDVDAVGIDSDADPQYDTWPAGVFFRNSPQALSAGGSHYRSFYHPAAADYVNGVLTLALGSGERRDMLYQGEAGTDDNNRFYVIEDHDPRSIGSTLTESNLVPVTSVATYVNPGGKKGYYFVGEESEKYVGDPVIFAGHVLTVSYKPTVAPACGPGEAFYLAFRVSNAKGFLDTNSTPEAADRRVYIGAGVPSSPRVSVGAQPTDDIVVITTSEGEVETLEPPLREDPESSVIFWRQLF